MFEAAMFRLEEGLEELRREDLDGIRPVEMGERIKRMRGFADRYGAEILRRVEAFDRDRGFAPSGATSTVSWMRSECNLSGFSADRQVKLARQLPVLGSTCKALAAGEIGIEHAEEIARATQDLGAAAEGELLWVAKEKDPAEVRLAARDLRHRVDADGMARLAAEQYRKRRLRIYNLADGMVGMDGALPPEDGAALRLTIESLAGIPPKGDDRTQEQRNADALSALLRRQLDAGSLPSLGGRKPQLTVVINAETLAGLPGAPAARLEGAGPISTETARRLLCRGGASLLTVNGKGVALDLGRSKRTASEGQRRALSARYRHCCTRGCDREARFCEPHHLDPWELGGGTSVERMVLLCSKHHVQVHEGGRPMEEPRAG